MYESYYGFAEEPFGLAPAPKYLYRSETHANALELFEYAVERREGFVVLTGERGMGKTTVCRALAERLDRQTVSALLLDRFVSEEDLLWAILQELGVVTRGAERSSGGPARQQLVSALHDFLRALLPLEARAVLIVDEAQNLPLPLLEQIRILSNFETDTDKILQIFLVGEPSLMTLLRSAELRQLDQRVSIRYQLQPLSEEEVGAYVAHRLSVANGNGVVFSPAALRMVHSYSGGIPRVINMLCDRALLGGYSTQTTNIDQNLVITAAEGLEVKPPARASRSWFERLLGRSRS